MSHRELILLPNLLCIQSTTDLLPPAVEKAVQELDGLIAESEKLARQFLKLFTFMPPKTFREVPLAVLNEHSKENEIKDLLKPLEYKGKWGVISDAGLPCLADPGARLVSYARDLGIHVRAIMGPSSIVLALMLSGFSGQSFAFLGYLPKEEGDCVKSIQNLSKKSLEGQTQIFIETPYRNEKLFLKLLETLPPDLNLCLAIDLTAPEEEIYNYRVFEWRKRSAPNLKNRPMVFLVAKK